MRVVYFGSPTAVLSTRILGWLRDRQQPPIFCVFDRPTLATLPDIFEQVQPQLGVSIKFPHRIPVDVLQWFELGVVNLHNGYLPWNRGKHTNVWPLVDGSPAGVALHWMDDKLDTGPIIRRDPVTVEPWDTAHSLYQKLDDAAFRVFTESWDALCAGNLPAVISQDYLAGSLHRGAELGKLDLLSLDSPTTARQVLNQLRARTYPGYRGVCFQDGGKTVEVTVNLREVAWRS